MRSSRASARRGGLRCLVDPPCRAQHLGERALRVGSDEEERRRLGQRHRGLGLLKAGDPIAGARGDVRPRDVPLDGPLEITGRGHRVDLLDRRRGVRGPVLRDHRERQVDVDHRLVPAVAGPGDHRLGVAHRLFGRDGIAREHLGERDEQGQVGGHQVEPQVGEPGTREAHFSAGLLVAADHHQQDGAAAEEAEPAGALGVAEQGIAAGDRLRRRPRALDQAPGHEHERRRRIEVAPSAAREGEHLLRVGVGGDRVAGEPREIGHQVGGARQPELVAERTHRGHRLRGDGDRPLRSERLGVTGEPDVLAFDARAGVHAVEPERAGHRHGAVRQRLGPVGRSRLEQRGDERRQQRGARRAVVAKQRHGAIEEADLAGEVAAGVGQLRRGGEPLRRPGPQAPAEHDRRSPPRTGTRSRGGSRSARRPPPDRRRALRARWRAARAGAPAPTSPARRRRRRG